MIVTLPVFKGDVQRLRDLLSWIRQLGGCPDHRAVIVADADTPVFDVLDLRDLATKAFKEAEIVSTESAVSSWPQGPNALFLKAAKTAEEIDDEWLFLEPDATPLCAGWLDAIDMRQRATGARYMGALVPCSTPGLPPLHMDGVAVYPPYAHSELAPIVAANPNVAFDISTAAFVCKDAVGCDLFQHLWGEKDNPPRFAAKRIPKTAVFDLDYLNEKAVIFHRNKDGSLIKLLRQRMGVQNPENAVQRTFIQLGRFGDIILLLPALKYIADMDEIPPRLIVSHEYASVLEGVSYVEPVPLKVHWWSGMPEARKFAEKNFGPHTVLQCYAHEWGIDLSKWPNFMSSMWDRTGVPLEMMKTLPLVFDQRRPERERSVVLPSNGKPCILVSHKGISSPFAHRKELLNALNRFSNRVRIVDVSDMRLPRIFDMLGVIDQAVGMVTIDSANLHLAYGSKRPFVALTVDGWCSSIPRGNCTLEVKYSQFLQRLPEIVSAVESWL